MGTDTGRCELSESSKVQDVQEDVYEGNRRRLGSLLVDLPAPLSMGLRWAGVLSIMVSEYIYMSDECRR